jgi:peroxin-14
MFEKTKEAQTASLSELQNELKSLKSLLVSRNASSGGSTAIPRPYSPYGSNGQAGDASNGALSPKPSIPAWQLASNDSVAAVKTTEDAKTEGYTVDSPATPTTS